MGSGVRRMKGDTVQTRYVLHYIPTEGIMRFVRFIFSRKYDKFSDLTYFKGKADRLFIFQLF